jgi:LmbE family N-acetylglucosaminyl deacetylase
MRIEPERILVVSPHTDDAEVSSGGTMARFLREGRQVFVAVLARASSSGEDPMRECSRALAGLGVPIENRVLLDFPVRNLHLHRQAILDKFLDLRGLWAPDLVLLPSWGDIHQDHQVAAQEGLRAFKDISILGYEYPWNHLEFRTTAFIKFDEPDLEKKIAAIAEYKSQAKDYMQPEVIRAWAITRGVAVKTRYAESFEVIRLVT